MNPFKFLKKKKAPAEEQFNDAQLNVWPSQPNEDKKVPSLEQILKHGGTNVAHVERLKEWTAAATEEGDTLEFQVVMESRYGMLTLPALTQKEKGGGFTVFYSHWDSDWDEKAVAKLLDWTLKVRNCDFIHSIRIEICDAKCGLPRHAKEIISKKREHRMVMGMIPYLKKKEAKSNARVFSECFAHFCNDNKLLNKDEESLQLIENWIIKDLEETEEESFYFNFYIRFIGAFMGEVLVEQCGAKWKEEDKEWPELFIPGAKLKLLKNGRAPGDMNINVFAIAANFIRQPKQDNSLILQFEGIKGLLK